MASSLYSSICIDFRSDGRHKGGGGGRKEVLVALDLKRLSRGELILGVTSLALLVISFFPLWSKVEGDGERESFSAWSTFEAGVFEYDPFGFIVVLALILALVAVVFVAMRAAGVNLNLPAPLGLVYLGLGGLTALLLILQILIGPEEIEGAADAGVEISRGIFLFLAALLALGMAAGGYLHMQEETGTPAAGAYGGPGTAPPPRQ